MRETVEPIFLNSGEMTEPVVPGATAKETRVGGTSISLKDPDMESFPPIAASRSSFCARKAPRRAAKGRPQRCGSRPSFGKYSCRVRRISDSFAPEATMRQADWVTA